MTTVAEVLSCVHRHYPPKLAESWDNVGLLVGDPTGEVTSVLLAVDVTETTLSEAIETAAQVLLTHHPLLFRPLTTVTTDQPKAALAIKALRHGVHIIAAHTNADAANPGVSDCLARAIGLADPRPMTPKHRAPLDKITTFLPESHLDQVRNALAAAGAGAIGDYDQCSFTSVGVGTFRPNARANPFIGTAGVIESTAEIRLEMVFPRANRAAIVAAHTASHPYEEPAFDIIALAEVEDGTGLGRYGRLPDPMTARELAQVVAGVIPATVTGTRLGGDPNRLVETVAVCGGSGDSFLDLARNLDVDAYITSDLRHHPASDALDWPDAPVLIDIPHWAAEWLWLPQAQAILNRELPTVKTNISTTNTDPWRLIIN